MSGSSPLGVVVVDYHTTDELRAFCKSLLEADPQLPYALMISVVDDQGMEAIEAGELADLFASRSLTSAVTTHTGNVGFNVAVNDGAKWLLELPIDHSEMTLAFFNSDTRIRPGVLESCVSLLWSDDTLGAVGPRQVSDHGKLTAAGIFGTLERPRHRGWQEPAGDRYTDIRRDCVTVSGSAYFVKAPVWEELRDCEQYRAVDPKSNGAFLTCRHYYGETFCSYHMHAHNYRLAYNGEATMIHKWHAASPVNHGYGEKNLEHDRAFFRRACDQHKSTAFPEGIPHD